MAGILRKLEKIYASIAYLAADFEDAVPESSSESSEQTDDSIDPADSAFENWKHESEVNDQVMLVKWKAYFNPDKITSEIGDVIEALSRTTIRGYTRGMINYTKSRRVQAENITRWSSAKRGEVIPDNNQFQFNTTLMSEGRLMGFDFFQADVLDTDAPSISPAGVLDIRTPPWITRLKHSRVKSHENGSLIAEDGGFSTQHAHTIPALFLRHHLRSLQNPHIELHVLCHGFKYTETDMQTWGYDYTHMAAVDNYRDMLRLLFHSDDLNQIRQNVITTPIRRILIWMMLNEHVALFCWDEFKEHNHWKHAICLYDNLDPSFLDIDELQTAFIKVHNDITGSPIDKDHVFCTGLHDDGYGLFELSKDFVCVSFMARCTLYLGMFESAVTALDRLVLSDERILEILRAVYTKFETDLHSFVETRTKSGDIILFPAALDSKFLNINSIRLVTLNSHSGVIREHVYYGMKNGFGLIDDVADDDASTGCFRSEYHIQQQQMHCYK